MSAVNLGTQEISFQYKEEAKALSFNKLLRKICRPGFYDGFLFAKVDNSTVSISTGTAWFNCDSDKSVSISTTTSVNQTVLAATPVLCLSFTWVDSVSNFIDWTWRAVGAALGTNEIVVGQVNFTGGLVDGTFNYANRTVGLIDTTGNVYATQYLKFDTTNGASISSTSSGLIFVAGGTEKVRIMADGKIGVNISAPISNLNLHQLDSAANLIHLTNSTTGTSSVRGIDVGLDASEQGRIWNYENTDIVIGTNNTARMYVKNDGKIGIVTASPGAQFDLNGITGWAANTPSAFINGINLVANGGGILQVNATTSQAIDIGGSIGFGGYYIAQTTSIDFAQIAGRKENSTSGQAGGYLAFSTRISGGNTTEKMRITNNGYVGIGITPSNPLHVMSTTNPQVRIGYDAGNYATLGVGATGILTLTATGSLALASSISSTVLISNTTECTGADTGALQVDGGADFAKHVNMQTNLTVGTGIVVTTGNINIVAGDLTFNGTPVAGWLSDGTPYYIKSVSITMNSGSSGGSVAHNISNAYTNHRILWAVVRRDSGTFDSWACSHLYPDGIEDINWDDTNIGLERYNTTQTYTWTVFITYI
jgi:hypothetical protein